MTIGGSAFYNAIMSIKLLVTLAPMLLMGGLGALSSHLKLLSADEVNGMKKLVSSILLPFLVFSSLCTLKLDSNTLMLMGLAMLFQVLLYGIGYLTTPFMGAYKKYHRFMIATSEPGMLGYALFMSLFGSENVGYITLLDAGQMLFFFCIVLPDLQRTASGTREPIFRGVLKNTTLWALALGLLANLSGAYDAIMRTGFSEVMESCLNMATAPVSGLMLFVIGYGISIEKKIMLPVVKTMLVRLPANMLLSLGATAVLLLAKVDTMYVWAFLVYGMLPSTFLATAYVKEELLQKHLNTFLSVYTLLTLLGAGVLYLFYC